MSCSPRFPRRPCCGPLRTGTCAGGYVQIWDAQGTPLLAYHSEAEEACHPIAGNASRGRFRVEIGIPRSILSARLQPVQRLMWVYLAVIVAVAVVMITLFASRSARPVRRLLDTLLRIGHTKDMPQDRRAGRIVLFGDLQGDYRRLEMGISMMGSDLERYQQTIRQQNERLMIHLLEKALLRGLYSANELAQFAAYFPEFPKRYRLAIFRYAHESPPDTDDETDLQLRIVQAIREQADIPFAHGMESDSVILLLPAETDDPWLPRLHALHRSLQAQHRLLSLTGAVSDPFSRVSDLPRAYDQAVSLECYPQGEDAQLVRDSHSMPEVRVRMPASITDMQTIHGALSAGNLQIALSVLEDCAQTLLADDENALMFRHVYTMISQVLVQIKLENPTALFSIILPTYHYEQRRRIFTEDFPSCFQAITQALWAAQREGELKRTQQVMDTIDGHLGNPAFGIVMAADELDLSAPTLQKIVKNVSGQTFAAYVEEKRLARAYHLLAEEGRTVHETAGQVGFASTNSFYKAFKRKYGITPASILKKNHAPGSQG